MTDETPASPLETEAQEPASTGIDAAIDRAVATIESRSSAPEEEAEALETSRKGNPYRARDGKFTSKPDTVEAAPEPGPAEPTVEPAVTTTAEPAQQPVEPPSRWSDADKQAFAKLPRDAQAVLVEMSKRQDADYTRKTQDVAETRKALEPFLQSVQQWSQHLRSINMHPVAAFDQAMRIDQILRNGNPQQKQALVAEIAQFAGVNIPAASGEAQPQAQAAEWVDPQVQQLSQTVQGLQQQLAGFHETHAQQERQRAEAEFATIGQTKNQDGSQKYPHFDRVRERMIKLVANGLADTWDEAYDMSVWGDAEMRTQIAESEKQKALEAARQAEEKRRSEAVQKAKGAAPVATSHGVKGGSKPKGLDALLDQTLASRGYQ